MKLYELNLELCRAQLQRQSAAGTPPIITSVNFYPKDADGKLFSCKATFSYGSDFTCEFELDGPADLSAGWEQRLDAAVFNNESRWPQ